MRSIEIKLKKKNRVRQKINYKTFGTSKLTMSEVSNLVTVMLNAQ